MHQQHRVRCRVGQRQQGAGDGRELRLQAALARAGGLVIRQCLGLGGQHQRTRAGALGQGEAVGDPGAVGGLALQRLGAHRGAAGIEAVARAHGVHRGEHHALVLPALVFSVGGMGRHAVGLAFQRQRALAERRRAGKEALAQGLQPLQRVVAAAVAIQPVVVAGGVDQCTRKALEVLPLQLVVGIAAGGRAVLEVAHVDGEAQAQAVDAVNQAAVQRARSRPRNVLSSRPSPASSARRPGRAITARACRARRPARAPARRCPARPSRRHGWRPAPCLR